MIWKKNNPKINMIKAEWLGFIGSLRCNIMDIYYRTHTGLINPLMAWLIMGGVKVKN